MDQLHSFVGVVAICLLAWLLSEQRRAVPWRTVAGGLLLQAALAVLLLKLPGMKAVFASVNDAVGVLDTATRSGTRFVFGFLGGGPLPFADGSAKHVYSEHGFEHLSYPDEAYRLLAECMRVLAPGAIFDVGVPDTERAIYDYYVERDPEKLRRARELWHRAPHLDLPLHQLNYHFYQGTEHKYAWDYETLADVLGKAKYTNIHRREFDPTLDDERRKGSLYIRAHKPG